MIYLDNAATSFTKPKSVYKRLNKYIKNECGNPGRSSHYIAAKTAEYVYEARETVATLFNNGKPENVIFTMNATYALNIAIKTLIPDNSHVIISDVEHNSTLRPLHTLCEKCGVTYSVFNSNASNVFLEIEKHIREDTSAIISTLVSNVDGRDVPIFALSAIKKKHGLFLIIDASQAAGHKAINLSGACYDAFIVPGHKGLFGIQGVGACIFGDSLPQKTLIEGGSGSESKLLTMPEYLPEKLEAGTLPTPSIIALCEGINFILSEGISKIASKEYTLTNAMRERLDDIKKVKIYGSNNGIVSFNVDGFDSEAVAKLLDEYKICTRAGLHCAPLAHRALGTENIGTVRASVSYFNTIDEIDVFWRAVKKISSNNL